MKYLVKTGTTQEVVEAASSEIDRENNDLVFLNSFHRVVARFRYWSSFRLIAVGEEGKKL